MHLCFSITAHGFGHGAISCSVINRLIQRYPDVKISVMSLLDKHFLDARISGRYDYYPVGSDFGMSMASAIDIDVETSKRKYQSLLGNWSLHVDSEKQLLSCIKPDWLISNISPVSLDAAQQLMIKTASVAPFNWAQIYKAYCLTDNKDTQSVYQAMQTIYRAVDLVFKPLPYVPLESGEEIPIASINDLPIADLSALLSKLPGATQRIGLIALGGLPFPLQLQEWPKIDGLHWLVDRTPPRERQDMSEIADLNIPFLQLVADCDLIITKPGYGTYCEIASVAKYKKIRVMSLVRPDWPETPYLNQFLSTRVPFIEIHKTQLVEDVLYQAITKVDSLDYPDEVACEDGAMQLVERLMGYRHK